MSLFSLRTLGSLLAIAVIVVTAIVFFGSSSSESTVQRVVDFSKSRSMPVAHAPSNDVSRAQATSPVVKDSPEDRASAGNTLPDDVDLNAPEVLEYNRFEEFRQDTRDYFDNAANTPQPQRSSLAVQLLHSVDWAEAQDYLLPVEALTIKLGLLQTTVEDEAVFKEVAVDLANSYKQKAEALEASIAPDPRDDEYRTEQARIVEDVLISTRDADPADRQTMLRERLTALRTRIYTRTPTE